MEEPSKTADAGAGAEEKKQTTVTLPSFDGTFKLNVLLEQEEDTNQPPRLVNISKQAVDSVNAQPSLPPSSASDLPERHIILSTGSGHQKAESFFQDVVRPILHALHSTEQDNWSLHTTQSVTSILELIDRELFPKANKGVKLRIVLASGDGGIVDLVNGLLSKPASSVYAAPQVVLLPLGTANALYHSVNACTDKESTWGLHALSSISTKPLPVFTATFSPGSRLLVDEARVEEPLPQDGHGNGILHGAVVCSWGMHASLVADSDTAAYRKFGIERFKMAAKEALHPSDGSPPHVYRAKVSILNGETWQDLEQDEHMYVLATLVSHLEAPFCISPASKPLDGSLHLVHFGPAPGEEAMRIMGLAYAEGKHVEDAAVQYQAIDGLRIEFGGKESDGRWRRICVDGKIVRVEGQGWVELRKERRHVADVVVGV